MPHPGFVDHCVELLSPLGTVRVRRMFGGHGFYVDELFVAILAGERLFLKAAADSAPRFEAAGGEPFTYDRDGKLASLGFWTPPAEAMESPELMRPWGRLAIQAALAARAPRPSAPGKKAARRR
jgi:DNA transformation protein